MFHSLTYRVTFAFLSYTYCAAVNCISDADDVFLWSLLVHLLAVFLGVQLSEFQTRSAVRTCGLSFSGNLVMYTTDKAMSQPCEMLVYDLRDEGQMSMLSCTRPSLLFFTPAELIFCISCQRGVLANC